MAEGSSIEKSLAFFEQIRVRVTFRDSALKDRAIAATCQIGFSESIMHIIAWKRIELLKQEKWKKLLEAGLLPRIDEENLHHILEMARELRVKWVVLMDIKLDLKKIATQGFESRPDFATSSYNLFLEVMSSQRLIQLELQKLKLNAWSPSKRLVEIEDIVRKYGRSMYGHI